MARVELLQQGMLRVVSLDQHRAWFFPSASAPRDLNDLLGQLFGSAKINPIKALISIHDANQRELGEIMPFGQHLGADDDAGLARLDFLQGRFQFTFTTDLIAIQTDTGYVGPQLRGTRFDPLGALSQVL